MNDIKVGSMVVDPVTGYVGIVTSIIHVYKGERYVAIDWLVPISALTLLEDKTDD